MSRLWVIDTNVIVSGLIYPRSTPGRIIDAGLTGLFDFAYDSRILAEYRDVLSRPKFGFSPGAIEGYLFVLLSFPPASPGDLKVSLPDPDDVALAEVALATPDRILVTGNRRHFSAVEKLGLRVINPTAALEVLDSTSEA